MTNNKQQTAVEWLVEQLSTQFTYGQKIQFERLFEMAKEMEKDMLTDAYHDGKSNGMDISHPLSMTKEISADEWYNETYGGGEQ